MEISLVKHKRIIPFFYQNVEISLGSKTAEWFILLNQSPKQSLCWIEMYDGYIRKDDQGRETDCLDQTIDQLFPQNVDRIIHDADSANSFVWKFVTALWQQMAFFDKFSCSQDVSHLSDFHFPHIRLIWRSSRLLRKVEVGNITSTEIYVNT